MSPRRPHPRPAGPTSTRISAPALLAALLTVATSLPPAAARAETPFGVRVEKPLLRTFPPESDLRPLVLNGWYTLAEPSSGNLGVPPVYDHIAPRDDASLYAATFGGRAGFLAASGAWIVEPVWDAADCFSESYATVYRGDEAFLIDQAGRTQLGPVIQAGRFDGGVAAVRTAEGGALIDRGLRPLTPPLFAGLGRAGEGFTAFAFRPGADDPAAASRRYAAFRRLCRAPVRRHLPDDAAGLPAAARGFLDRAGRVVFVDFTGELVALDRFVDGLAAAAVTTDRGVRWGYLDRRYRFAVTPEYLEARRFADGYAAVRTAAGWGYLNRAGRVAVEPAFDDARPFAGARAAVKHNGVWGYVGPAGRVQIEPQFADAHNFRDGVARVEIADGPLAGQTGLITAAGAVLVHPGFYRDGVSDRRDDLRAEAFGRNLAPRRTSNVRTLWRPEPPNPRPVPPRSCPPDHEREFVDHVGEPPRGERPSGPTL